MDEIKNIYPKKYKLKSIKTEYGGKSDTLIVPTHLPLCLIGVLEFEEFKEIVLSFNSLLEEQSKIGLRFVFFCIIVTALFGPAYGLLFFYKYNIAGYVVSGIYGAIAILALVFCLISISEISTAINNKICEYNNKYFKNNIFIQKKKKSYGRGKSGKTLIRFYIHYQTPTLQ